MSDKKQTLFLSHSSGDSHLVTWLKETLETYVNVEVFTSDIKTSENWFETIAQHLDSAEALILLLTPTTLKKSDWVWFEFGYFYRDSQKATVKKCYPLCKNVETPGLLRDLHIEAASISDRENLLGVFEQLRSQFGDNDTEFDIDKVMAEIKGLTKPSMKQVPFEGLSGSTKRSRKLRPRS